MGAVAAIESRGLSRPTALQLANIQLIGKKLYEKVHVMFQSSYTFMLQERFKKRLFEVVPSLYSVCIGIY